MLAFRSPGKPIHKYIPIWSKAYWEVFSGRVNCWATPPLWHGPLEEATLARRLEMSCPATLRRIQTCRFPFLCLFVRTNCLITEMTKRTDIESELEVTYLRLGKPKNIYIAQTIAAVAIITLRSNSWSTHRLWNILRSRPLRESTVSSGKNRMLPGKNT